MKKLFDRLTADSDRTKLLISIAAVVLTVVLAMLLPLAFRTEPEGGDGPRDLTLEERTQLFSDYWMQGAEAGGYTVERPDPVPRKMKETCETVMRTMIARIVLPSGY